MQRKTKVAVIGAVAGSTVIMGMALAFPALAHENTQASAAPCLSNGASNSAPTGASGPSTKGRKHRAPSNCASNSGNPSAQPSRAGGSQSAPPAASSSAARPSSAAPATPTAVPTTSAAASCTSYSGSASNVASPGVGAVTVTIKVCGGALSTSTGTISQSNWNANTAALASLNTLAVQYYKTSMSKITYSGATLTANAYQASLQSALTKAGL